MKRLTLLAIALFTALSSFAQGGINFFEGSYTEALEKAQKEDKLIFVDVYTSWCGPCKMMSKLTFTDPNVGGFYNAKFIALKLDAEKESDSPFFKNYQATSFPSYFWLDAKGDLLLKEGGYMKPDAFLELTERAMHSSFTTQAKALKARWDGGERSLDLLHNYVYKVVGTLSPKDVGPMVIEFLDSKSDEELKSEELYPVVLSTVGRGLNDSRYSKLAMLNADTYKNYGKRYDYWERMYRTIVRAGAMKNSHPGEAEKHLATVYATGSPLAPMYEEILALEAKIFAGNFAEAIPAIIPLVEKYAPEHNYLYKQLFYTLIIGDYFTDAPLKTEEVEIVRQIALRAMKDQPCKENLIYIAATYAKEGNHDQAYQCLASFPFFSEPMLSNALYKRLNIKFYGAEFR